MPSAMRLDLSRQADAAGIGEAFQPRRDVDRVAQQVGAVAVDEARMKADAIGQKLGALRRLGKAGLDGDGGADGRGRFGEFGEHAVACGGEDAALMLFDGAEDQRLADGERAQGQRLVPAHGAAVAHRVGGEDGRGMGGCDGSSGTGRPFVAGPAPA